MVLREVQQQRVLMGRLRRGDDLLDALTAICKAEGIRLGRITALGAVECARVAVYDQQKWEYYFLDMDGPMELLLLVGNISLRDGETVIHAHATFGNDIGTAQGGHLVTGTRVFACEFTIDVYHGEDLHRVTDEQTGLPLWKEE